VNRQLERKGRLFADRYHARALTTPRAVKFALRYVLLNARKHAPTAGSAGLDGIVPGFVDSCSSAPWFRAFARPDALAFGARAARDDWHRATGSPEPPVAPAHTWLLRSCLQRHGPFDPDETPARHFDEAD